MDRLSLSAMSFAGFGLLLIAGTGVAGAGRTHEAGPTCARLAADVAGAACASANHAKQRAD